MNSEAPHCIVCDAPATTTCGDHHSPLTADELAKLRACLHDEQALPNGADPAVHGLYDYYETTKRLVNSVDQLRELLASGVAFVRDANQLMAADGALDEEDEAQANEWIASAQAALQ